jgi:hypothetical protein
LRAPTTSQSSYRYRDRFPIQYLCSWYRPVKRKKEGERFNKTDVGVKLWLGRFADLIYNSLYNQWILQNVLTKWGVWCKEDDHTFQHISSNGLFSSTFNSNLLIWKPLRPLLDDFLSSFRSLFFGILRR